MLFDVRIQLRMLALRGVEYSEEKLKLSEDVAISKTETAKTGGFMRKIVEVGE